MGPAIRWRALLAFVVLAVGITPSASPAAPSRPPLSRGTMRFWRTCRDERSCSSGSRRTPAPASSAIGRGPTDSRRARPRVTSAASRRSASASRECASRPSADGCRAPASWIARAPTLRFFAERMPQEHGWFFHFINLRTGAREWQSELSSIDTALLVSWRADGAALLRRRPRDCPSCGRHLSARGLSVDAGRRPARAVARLEA